MDVRFVYYILGVLAVLREMYVGRQYYENTDWTSRSCNADYTSKFEVEEEMFHTNYGNPLRNHGHLKQGGKFFLAT